MNPDDIIESMLACKETDLSAILSLNIALRRHPDIREDHLRLASNITFAGNLVKNNCIGEGILIGEDEKGRIGCILTFGISDYSYMTNDGYFRDTSYKSLMIDLIGRLKDGDINVLDLFLRRNTNPGGSIEAEIDYILPSVPEPVILSAVDKFDLSSMMELNEFDDESITDWYDRIYGILPRHSVERGEGQYFVITQCNLYDTVTLTRFDCIETVVDTMLNETVIYLSLKAQ